MKLKALLQDVETKSVYTFDPEITNVTDNSSKVRRQGLFVCIKGNSFDGHDFAQKAMDRGAVAVICERDIGIKNSIIVEDSRKAYAQICSAFYSKAHKKLRMIAVTGTNGKTTTSYIIKKILESSGLKTGLIGTVNVTIGKERYPADLTTPDPVDLHRYLMLMNIAGCDACVMEVSSQALEQERVYGINFDCAVFTNLSPEHLDYHKTMQNYARAKSKLFEMSKVSVINSDDEYAPLMLRSSAGKTYTYGTDENADFRAEKICLSADGVDYSLSYKGKAYRVAFPGMGIFSVSNSLAAVSAASVLGVDIPKAIREAERFEGISGRMEKIDNSFGINIIIDYAHTPASLENAAKTLKEIYDGRLITVFGCGGDRDKDKRPMMGKIACENSDFVFITSDNPRTENPEMIINDILSGINTKNYYRITDRKLAIKSALYSAVKGDTVLIAGKGHEKYQIIGNQKIYFNEREIIRKLLEDKARF
ncbi:MAG: UDP-N-acetylmuramoyl-L-alanyl-D-glutamate--2,6-diaminopimelate ligase [Clostridia bacterium]|nr:UDP-N-acetylmuramoyl-L-alanyl-D-glutamate--2,6-diaminopimelate ligase [Clostridia bacterium]